MLTAYKHDENHRLCPVAFEEMEKGSWINCAAPDAAELEKLGWSYRTVWLYDLEVRPCRACRVCQQDWTVFGLTVKNVPTWNWKTILFSSS